MARKKQQPKNGTITKPKGNRSPFPTGRPKPMTHAPGLTRSRRRYGCGGAIKTKTA